MESFEGYHGTDASNFSSIKKRNFSLSSEYNDWLGRGIYFFMEGISDPVENAVTWAKASAWDKENKTYKYQYYCVVFARITVENVLDLTQQEGLVAFNRFRNKLVETYLNLKKDFTKGHKNPDPDNYIFNTITEAMELDAIINNLYIKDVIQRKNRIDSRVPNTTVLCVKSSEHIDKNSIENRVTEEVKNGH